MDRQFLRLICCLAGLAAVPACRQTSLAVRPELQAPVAVVRSPSPQPHSSAVSQESPAPERPAVAAGHLVAGRHEADAENGYTRLQPAPDSPFAQGIHGLLAAATPGEEPARVQLTALEDEAPRRGGHTSANAAQTSAGVWAAPPAEGTTATMSLAEIESLALASNPSLRQAAAIAQKAVGNRQQVGLYPNPTIAYMGQEIGDDGTYGQQGIQIEQTFVRGRKLELNERVADQEVQRLLWQVEVQRQRVLTDVRRQYYATLGAQQRIVLTQELETLAAEAAENFRILFENAQGSRADLLQAEILRDEISILRQQAVVDRDANWRRLASLMGRPGQAPPQLDGDLDSDGPERDWHQSAQEILASSPQLQQAYAEAQRARAQIQRAEVQRIPNVELQASLMHMAMSDNVGANVTLGLPIPFFNRNQGNVYRAWAEYHRAQHNVERLRMSLQSELAAAFGQYRDAAIRVAVLRDDILPRQAESVRLIELGYPTQFDFLRLFSARRAHYDARVQYLNALVDLRQAESLIDGLLLTGGLSDVEDTQLDDQLRDAALGGQ